MFIEREAYLQEYYRREMEQGLEAKRLAKLVQTPRSRSRKSFGHMVGHLFQVLRDNIRVVIGRPKVAGSGK